MSTIEELETQLNNLRKVIKERKEQANNSKLPGKIQKVVETHGEYSDWGGGEYNYREKGLSIKYTYHSQKYIKVDLGYDSKDVFTGKLHHNGVADINLYIPGDWEKRIDELYNEIPEITNDNEILRLQNTILNLEKKWEIEV